jgi:hypothetical protein
MRPTAAAYRRGQSGDHFAACAIAYLNFRRVAPGWCATRPQLVKLVDALFQRASFARTEPPGLDPGR